MKAMILAAGRGKRMGVLTDHQPKPLIQARNKPLIVYNLEKLASSGFHNIVINVAYQGHKIRQFLGNGQTWGLSIEYSIEEPKSLETGGGIAKALPLIGTSPFLVMNADVYCELDLSNIHAAKPNSMFAHVFLTKNPAHHPEGDFSLSHTKQPCLSQASKITYTYTGIGVFSPIFFSPVKKNSREYLSTLLNYWITYQRVSGTVIDCFWQDIGTPERLSQLELYLSKSS